MDKKLLKKEAKIFLHDYLKDSLGVNEIKEKENLMHSGLTSIITMQISNQLRKFGMRIPFSKLALEPILSRWFSMIDEAEISVSSEKSNLHLDDKNEEFELTDVQYAYWSGRDENQPLGGVGCHAYIEFEGYNIDLDKLNEAWKNIQYHHPMLRASFSKTGKQKILTHPYSAKANIYDLQGQSKEVIERELISIRNSISHRKLDIEKGEVAGLTLVKLPKKRHRMILDIDLLVADVLSLSILIRDLAEAYNGKVFSNDVSYTFREYLTEKKVGEILKTEDKEFWDKKIADLEELTPKLPLKKRPETIDFPKFKRRKKIVNGSEWKQIKKICAEKETTPSMVLLACYVLVLERWCNQDSFLINIPLFNREVKNADVQEMIADFTNLLLLEFKRRKGEVFQDTIKRVHKTFLENVEHSSYSAVAIEREIHKKTGGSGQVAPVVFACNVDIPLETELSRKMFGDISYMVSQTPQVWLDFQIYVKDEDLILCWDAVEELFPERLLDDMFEAYVKLLSSLKERKAWQDIVDVMPERQKRQRQKEVMDILPLECSSKLLYSDYIQWVKKRPERVALIEGSSGKTISYEALYRKSGQIAGQLIQNGIAPGDYVGIVLPRGVEQIYAILGILIAGGVYVPIGINQPANRRRQICSKVGVKVFVTNRDTFDRCCLNEEGLSYIYTDEIGERIENLEPVLRSPRDSAYVIMTSGSTGDPKGVEESHAAAKNTIDDVVEKIHVSSSDTLLMVSAIDFDLSVFDLFALLGQGGRLVVLDEETYRSPDVWLELMEKYRVTLWNSTPIQLDMCITMAEKSKRFVALSFLKAVMLSGDWVFRTLLMRLLKLTQNVMLLIMGGATEGGIWSNYILITTDSIPEEWETIPYGFPLKKQVYKVVDKFERLCPDYVPGELWIGGAGVAKGYCGDEQLTYQKFVQDVIRWYKTGDRGAFGKNGILNFLGRMDNQVKIKGYRIELGEIEQALKKIPYVLAAFVCIIDKEEKQLAAYLVVESQLDVDIVKQELEKHLPSYMIPEKYYFSKEIPQMRNGKPDKKQMIHKLQESYIKNDCILPKTEWERKLSELWKRVLKQEKISRNDNYFRLGGDSLKAVTIVTEIEKMISIPVNVSTGLLYTFPTLKELAKAIEEMEEETEVEVI